MKDRISVAIIGGGIAGAELTRYATTERLLNVTLIEPKSWIEVQALYPDFLAGLVRIEDLTAPLLPFCWNRGATLVDERAIGLEKGAVICENRRVKFDVAVIATGAEQNFFGVKGTEHAFSINTLDETIRAREFLERENPSRIMIVGSGLTGIETACVLADSVESDIYIVEMMERLLPQFTQSTSSHVEKALYRRGVNVLTSKQVEEVRADSISFSDGSSLDCDMAIWTTGIKPSRFVEGLDLPKKRGWLLTDPYFRVKDEIYAIGDNAWIEVDGRLATKTGIEAERQAKHMAENLVRMAKGHPLAPYSVLASTDNPMALISVGSGSAVGVYGGLCVAMPSRLIHGLKIWIDKSIAKRYR
jgi:NADH dehydrogenase